MSGPTNLPPSFPRGPFAPQRRLEGKGREAKRPGGRCPSVVSGCVARRYDGFSLKEEGRSRSLSGPGTGSWGLGADRLEVVVERRVWVFEDEHVGDRKRRLPLEVLGLVPGELGPGLGFGELLGDGAVEVGIARCDELEGSDDFAVEPRRVGGTAVLQAAGEHGLEHASSRAARSEAQVALPMPVEA